MKIKKGDTVEVISGKDKGVRGAVHLVFPRANRLVVSGVNMIKKHQRRTGDAKTQFGIIEREAPMNVSNVAFVCPHCDKAIRVGYRIMPDGSRVRVCRKCNEIVD